MEADESRTDRMVVNCKVKVDAVDNWMSIGSSTIQTSSFLDHLPNLQRTPPTKISDLSKKLEVTQRFELEEGHINHIENERNVSPSRP